MVSIPNGLPRPFSLTYFSSNGWLNEVSIPNGLPRPFSQAAPYTMPSPRDLFQSRTGFPGHLAAQIAKKRKVTILVSIPNGLPRPFSLFLIPIRISRVAVSIPNGLPRPFSLSSVEVGAGNPYMFQSRTGFPGHLAKRHDTTIRRCRQSFNPERASQAI